MQKIIYRTLFILAFSFAVHSSTAQDKEVGGITMPGKVVVEKQDLILNGAGIREKYWIDLYVCGLYLTTRSSDSQKIQDANEKMAIRLHIISSFVTNERMQDAVRVGFEKSTHNNTAGLEEKINVVIGAFSDPIKVDDVYEIYYTPAGGSVIYKNGVQKTIIEGLYFKQVLFGIWLGDNPAHKELKEELMGG